MHNNKIIGILGGTFDPIHIGHLRMGLELAARCKLTEVHMMPCAIPTHRFTPVASAEQRLAMVKLAVENIPSLMANDAEVKRGGISYTIDTLTRLKQQQPNSHICLLLGMDAFAAFTQWHNYPAILQLAHIVVAKRPQEIPPFNPELERLITTHQIHAIDFIHNQSSGGIYICPIPALEISATSIREQFAGTTPPYFLLPERVLNYIHQHGLYTEKT